MKRVYKYLCVGLFSFLIMVNQVFAAGFSTSVTSNSVTVGGSVGGLVGFARYIGVTDSSTEGIIKKYGIDYLTYIGGIIGCAQSSTIINSGTAITFNELVNGAYKDTISVVTIKDKYIGAIVGSISILNEVPAAITNCYMPANEELSEEEQLICKDKTNVTTSKITIGIYGDKNEKVTMTGCYIKVEET